MTRSGMWCLQGASGRVMHICKVVRAAEGGSDREKEPPLVSKYSGDMVAGRMMIRKYAFLR